MGNKSVVCIAKSTAAAESIVDTLRTAGFTGNDISVLFPDQGTSRDFAHEMNTKAPEGAVTGATTGGLAGGALGWLAGIGLLAIPGAGPFIAAGPIVAAISGVAIGGTLGGITGGLIGMGYPELEAQRYAGKLKENNVLISVHTEDSTEINRAKQIFESAGAEDISTIGEASAPAPSKA